jgi:hypothetical protein
VDASYALVAIAGEQDGMKSQQEREADRRREKLLEIERQISAGSLVVRQMTPEERRRNPPRPPRPKRD